jgi:hypothetical protein
MEEKLLEVYVVMSCDRQAGDQIRGQFYPTLDGAKAEIDRLYKCWESDKPKWIERTDSRITFAGFQVISRWGQWRSYCIKQIDRFDRMADDCEREAIEGDKAKAGVLG